jgi:hypothetical protein
METTMAKRKNWKFTRNGTEYTLSVGGLMKFHRGGWYCDSDGFSNWRGEPWEEIVTILAFRKTEGTTFKQKCFVKHLDGNGKINWDIISASGQSDTGARFQHLDE